MEEILASIRRIISEDGNETDGAPAAARAASAPQPRAEDSEVLDLTDMVEDDGTVVNLREPARTPGRPTDEFQDTVELTERESEEEAATFDEPAAAPQEPPKAPEPEPRRPVEPDPHGVPTRSEFESELLSRAAAAAAAAPLANLVGAVNAQHAGTPIGQGNRTIEDLVKEVMRPMIRDWLDANLPALVERLVRKEIERLSRQVEDS